MLAQAVLVVVQLVVAKTSHSAALAADAGHNLVDIATLILALVALRIALRPKSSKRSFGNHRAAVLAALANTVLIVAVSILILYSAFHQLVDPTTVNTLPVVLAALFGLVVNAASVLVIEPGHDVNLRSAALHLSSDALTSLAVLISAIVMSLVPSATWADPAAAFCIVCLIAVQATKILSSSLSILWQSTPSDIDPLVLAAALSADPEVREVHDVHVWSLDAHTRVLTAHIVLRGNPALTQAQLVTDRLKEELTTTYAIAHSTLELECEHCHGDPDAGLTVRARSH
jgi:cobalt-zinc-cadmium efflux system protein